jgi:DNA-binding HxlR family transcriptional regulator
MLTQNYNQNCPIARALDVLGEPLTLLILRELVAVPAATATCARSCPALAPTCSPSGSKVTATTWAAL